MKKILVSFVAIMAVASSAMAAETMNMHDQVNNAQAPAHQMQSTSEKSAVQGDSMTMMGKRAARTVLTGMCYSVGSATRQGSSSL
ncbi:hypothetical protein V6708_26355, partial [Klebsiella pneumoniae]